MQAQNNTHVELQQQGGTQNTQVVQSEPAAEQISNLYGQAKNKFITKVYIILGVQLCITTCFVALTIVSSSFNSFQKNNYILQVVSPLTVIGLVIGFISKRQWGLRYPANMFLLALFILAQAYSVSSVAAVCEPQTVMIATGSMTSSLIGLTICVIKIQQDLSRLTPAIIAFACSFLSLVPFLIIFQFTFWPQSSTVMIGQAFGMIWPIYLLYNTQRIVNNIKHKLSVDQFVLASMLLYADIIGIFVHILKVIGRRPS